MVGRRWPAAGMSHVASNIHVAGGRNAFSQRSPSNMQVARLALSKVNEKMRGRCIDRSLRSMEETAAIAEVERLGRYQRTGAELSSEFGMLSERSDILAGSPRWDRLHVYSRTRFESKYAAALQNELMPRWTGSWAVL
jgi:hypothetical protein